MAEFSALLVFLDDLAALDSALKDHNTFFA